MATALKIQATVNGQRVELELDDEALALICAGLEPKEPAPIVGYQALSDALAAAGIKKCVRALKEWNAKGKLPHRRFNRRPTFYLSEVLERIGGRS